MAVDIFLVNKVANNTTIFDRIKINQTWSITSEILITLQTNETLNKKKVHWKVEGSARFTIDLARDLK